jgi:uncharacterized protein (DUF488 family)
LTIYTIGFTKKTAEKFFEALRDSGARHLLDIRLSNNSQLAGFTKRNDLRYFLKRLVNVEYHEVPILAPEESILNEYRKTGDWARYEKRYLELIQQRGVEKHINPVLFKEGVVLLCSESEPTHCHRRLAAEYLAQAVSSKLKTEIVHL